MSDTVYQINDNIIYHKETSVKHANSSPESQNEYGKCIEEAVNKENDDERLTRKRQATAERIRKVLKENETGEQLKRRRKILAERQRNYRKGKRDEALKKNETDEQLKRRRKIHAERQRNYRKCKRDEALKKNETDEQLKRRRQILAERQRNYRKGKFDDALNENEKDEQLERRRKMFAERQRNYRNKRDEALKKNETDEQFKLRRKILAEKQRNYRNKRDEALKKNETDEQLKRRRKIHAEKQRIYRNKRDEALKKNETDEQLKSRRKILAERQRNYRKSKRDEALKKNETDEQLKRRRQILAERQRNYRKGKCDDALNENEKDEQIKRRRKMFAERQRNYRKRKREKVETVNDTIEDSDIVMKPMADLNQGGLASYLIKELIGSSTNAQPVNRISQFLEELKQALNGVVHPPISYESVQPEFNAQFLNPFPDADLFRYDKLFTKYNDERVRSRTYRAACCDVTLIALHAPQCQRYGTQSRLSSHQPASTIIPNYLSTCHNTLLGGIDASSCYAPLPSNHTLPTPKTNSNSGDQITVPLITPALTTKIDVSPLEYVVNDSSWSSEDRRPIKVDAPEKKVVNNLARNSYRACKNKKRKTFACKPYVIWDENKAKQANALIEEATNHEGDDFSNYSVRRMSERLGVSQSSFYKYLKLTRPETEGGPRKVLNLAGRRGLTESAAPTSATYTEFTEHLYKILEKEEALTVTQIRERLPVHLRRTNPSIIKNLKRMNCVRRTVSAITASKNILAIQARSGGCHNVSGYWSLLNRPKSSVKEKPAVEVISEPNKTFLKNDQVIMVRKAYADCILSLSQPNTADVDTKFGDATFLKSLIFVSYKRYPIELIPKGIEIEGTASSEKGPILEIFVTLSVKGVMDYAVNIVNNSISAAPVANTFVPFVRHTVDLINRARFINNLVSLVLVVDRGTCPDMETKLDDARSNMTFKDPSHSLIYLPPASDSLNPISQFMYDLRAYVKSNYPFTLSSNGEALSAKAAALSELSSSYIKAVANNDFTPLYKHTQKYICMAANYEYF